MVSLHQALMSTRAIMFSNDSIESRTGLQSPHLPQENIMRNSLLKLFSVALVSAVLTACSSTETRPGDEVAFGGSEAQTSGLGSSQGLSEAELAEQQRLAEAQARNAEDMTLREVRTFYFDFDNSVVKPEAHLPLRAHAAFLAANPGRQIVLNGYADERGTKEYNLALGERRAQAVERFLVVNGASDTQIEVVSFGEEFPANPGNDEAAWSQNRRVVLEYK